MSPELEATVGDWVYISCHCIVNLGSGLTWSKDCVACRKTNLRYIHTLAHIDDDERIVQVGIDCARVLMGPDEAKIPRLAENETKRKESWRIHYRRPGRCVTTVKDLKERGKL